MSVLSAFYVFFVVFATLFGIVIGSFLNVVIYRTPEGRTISKGHSMCMSCGHVLGAKDLVPLFSWLFLRGKCRYCKAPVPSRYAKIESLTGLIFCIAAYFHKEAILCMLIPENLPVVSDMVYYCLFVISAAATISAMMIYHDTGKSFLRIAMFSIVPGILATGIFVYFYGSKTIGQVLTYILITIAAIVVFVGIEKLLSLVFRNTYTKTDLFLDLSFAGMMLFSRYLWVGRYNMGLITYGVYAVVYSVLRQSLKGKASEKYVGIIAASLVVICLCLEYIYRVIYYK